MLYLPVGISHVRIPVAYWYWQVEEGEPFPQPNLDDQDETR
jgi:aryl-phospho-beta-D-glucosidase BglC (GH1 family)